MTRSSRLSVSGCWPSGSSARLVSIEKQDDVLKVGRQQLLLLSGQLRAQKGYAGIPNLLDAQAIEEAFYDNHLGVWSHVFDLAVEVPQEVALVKTLLARGEQVFRLGVVDAAARISHELALDIV